MIVTVSPKEKERKHTLTIANTLRIPPTGVFNSWHQTVRLTLVRSTTRSFSEIRSRNWRCEFKMQPLHIVRSLRRYRPTLTSL